MATPSDKSQQMEDFLENITGKNRRKTIEANQCMTCDKPATEFRDELSRHEYTISGMCQVCQDATFDSTPTNEDEDDYREPRDPPPTSTFNPSHAAVSNKGVIRGVAYDHRHDAYMITLDPQWQSPLIDYPVTLVFTEAELVEIIRALDKRKNILDYPVPAGSPSPH